jgi:threonine/homoserine/homoserine lactone efflux protein
MQVMAATARAVQSATEQRERIGTMTGVELSGAILALLLTPGPTNTLLLVSGADRGFRASLRLIPAEVVAYVLLVLPLALLAQVLHDQIAALRPVIAVAAGAWVLWLAWGLWSVPMRAGPVSLVSARRVFVTTLLNPKGLIFGLVLLPAAPSLLLGTGLFVGLIVLVAMIWAAAGAVLPRKAGGALPPVLRRAAACWLAVLSVGIVAGGFSA